MTYVGSYAHGTSCFDKSQWGDGGIGDYWMLWKDIYHVQYYHRVVHCDNSYTDTYTGDDYFASWCWDIWAQDALRVRGRLSVESLLTW